MLWTRARNHLPREPYSRHIAWDASEQGGRDYELVVVRSIMKSHLSSLYAAMMELRGLWVNAPWGRSDRDSRAALLERERAIMDEVRPKILVHAPPAAQVGFGAGTFPRKLKALMHSLRLDTFTDADLAAFVAEFHTNMNDYG